MVDPKGEPCGTGASPLYAHLQIRPAWAGLARRLTPISISHTRDACEV